MAIEKCINEFDAGDVIFEEGSTGRELFVVLEGEVEIAFHTQRCEPGSPSGPGHALPHSCVPLDCCGCGLRRRRASHGTLIDA